MARKFFYVCAGLFLLVLGAILGSMAVRAQTSPPELSLAEAAHFFGTKLGGVINRVVVTGGANSTSYTPEAVTPPVPGISPIIAVDPWNLVVLLANGDVYVPGNPDWALVGNMLAGVVGVPAGRPPSRLDIRVAPNPVRGSYVVTYDLPTESEAAIDVLDAQGRIVKRVGKIPARAGRSFLNDFQ